MMVMFVLSEHFEIENLPHTQVKQKMMLEPELMSVMISVDQAE